VDAPPIRSRPVAHLTLFLNRWQRRVLAKENMENKHVTPTLPMNRQRFGEDKDGKSAQKSLPQSLGFRLCSSWPMSSLERNKELSMDRSAGLQPAYGVNKPTMVRVKETMDTRRDLDAQSWSQTGAPYKFMGSMREMINRGILSPLPLQGNAERGNPPALHFGTTSPSSPRYDAARRSQRPGESSHCHG
jgi:hypothetical protein